MAAPPESEKPTEGKEEKWKLWTDDYGPDIHDKLRSIRIEEFNGLVSNPDNVESALIAQDGSFFSRVYTETRRYLSYVFNTWRGLAYIATVGGVSLFDLGTMIAYAVIGTVVLGFVLVLCLFATSEPVTRWYWNNAKKTGNKNSFINASNPRLFQTLTMEQFNAATEALCVPIDKSRPELNPGQGREFNLDIAKLLMRLAAVVYEYRNQDLRKLIVDASRPSARPLPANTKPSTWSWDNLKWFFTVPGDPIKYLTLSEYVNRNRTVDTTTPQFQAAKIASGPDEGAALIHSFCQRFATVNADGTKESGLEYETISQLGDTSSAVSGLFWKPKENWIAVVFKGTSPLEYGEWLSNLDVKMSPVGAHINGFRRVHRGFKERVFPDRPTKAAFGTTPYDTINLGIQTLAKHLLSELPDDPKFINSEGKKTINIWFTGTSLGCATATLAYSKFQNTRGKKMHLRDAFLFATPIVSDQESVDAFNSKMLDDNRHIRTMWRVTSPRDFVAKSLPNLGDYRNLVVSPNNAFAFAHLGTEINMRDGPLISTVEGNHLPYGTVVKIVSKFTPEQLVEQYRVALLKRTTRSIPAQDGKPEIPYVGPDADEIDQDEVKRLWRDSFIQQLPWPLGPLYTHGTVTYTDQLDRLALGQCQWVAQ